MNSPMTFAQAPGVLECAVLGHLAAAGPAPGTGT